MSTWGCCSASWHPSILGHELRASHYSFFWLGVYKDALESILTNLKKEESVSTQLSIVLKHTHHERKHTQDKALYPSSFSDDIQCITAFHPIANKDSDLELSVINNNVDKKAFKKDVFESLMDANIVAHAMAAGYKDFKYMFYGNSDSKPLSIKVHIKKTGVVFICQPPGVWGRNPDKFKNLWNSGVKAYLTSNVDNFHTLEKMYFNGTVLNEKSSGNSHIFDFKPEKSKELKLLNDKPNDSQSVCSYFTETFPTGYHVLTLVPADSNNIMISTLLLP